MNLTHTRAQRNPEQGMTLFMVAAGLFLMLGIAALAIDLASLYVARSEAQRAADSAALAGAKQFVRMLEGGITESTAQSLARQDAVQVGGQNKIAGQDVAIDPNDVAFDFSVANNPRITVAVKRTAATANAMPTFFARALGVDEVDVSATATAEAYRPGNGGPEVCVSCIKPWLIPNCDAEHPVPANGLCGGPPSGKFINESTGAVVNPGHFSSGGVIGQPLTLKYGSPTQNPTPSQFYAIDILPGSGEAVCASCAPDSSGVGANLYRYNITCCTTNQFVCGQSYTVQLQTGNMTGPTRLGVQCLIHQGNGNSGGQDILDPLTLQITGGDNHPNPAARGQIITNSSSIATIPIYDGHELCPGSSCPANFNITIVGFMKVFIEEVRPNGDVRAYILGITGCGSGGAGGNCNGGTGGGGGGGTIGGGTGGSPIPVRLIRN